MQMLNTMRYKEGFNKQQTTLMPKCLDEYIPQDHMCRVIHAFTQNLDMNKLGYKYAQTNTTGNKPYNPKMMLNLYIYGYLHRIRSSRRLQAETTKNLEVMWLTDELTPDDKTIANFRSDNAIALKQTFRTFTLILNGLDLYSKELVATDGVKFRANNSRKNNHNPTTIKTKIANIDKQINEHLNAIEKNDQQENKEEKKNQLNTEQRQDLIKKLKDKKVDFEKLLTQVEKDGEISTVDPDARMMHSGGDNRSLDVCYNTITTTDAKHKLIVDFKVTNQPNDSGSLHTMSEKAKEVMGVETFTNLADKGFYDGADIAACEADGVSCLVANPKTSGPKKGVEFGHERFVYNKELDCYVCPCEKRLLFKRMDKYNGVMCRAYENYAVCRVCLRWSECTKGRCRKIMRYPHADVLAVVDVRTKNGKEVYSRRREIVEHPFGVVKVVWGFKQFLCRGLVKVTGETALAFLAYNFRRVFNIFGADGAGLVVLLGC